MKNTNCKNSLKTELSSDKINWVPINAGIAIVIVVYLLYFIYFHSNYNITKSDISLGEFGDYFGALNALFTVAAFIAAGIAIYMQSHELKLSRDSILLQTNELKGQREEMTLNRFEFETNRIVDIILKQIDRVNLTWKNCMIDNETELLKNKRVRTKGGAMSNSVRYSGKYGGPTLRVDQIVDFLKERSNDHSLFDLVGFFTIVYPAITSLSVAAYMVKDYENLTYRYKSTFSDSEEANRFKNSIQVMIRENLPLEFVKFLDAIDLETYTEKEKILKVEEYMNTPADIEGENSTHELFYEIESYLVVIDEYIGLKYDKGVRQLAGDIGFRNTMKLERQFKNSRDPFNHERNLGAYCTVKRITKND